MQKTGILGVIKCIGPKSNMNGSLISEDTHYVIQLEEYVGNGNGSWHGYQNTNTLRPDHTMHLCKLNNIRCKRSGDDVLKALYNVHPACIQQIQNTKQATAKLHQ
eukprot:136468_1